MSNSRRSANVDVARFIAALVIMTHHLNITDIQNTLFGGGWIYVEFFCIITGYYTARHFEDKAYANPVKESIAYTLKKFIPFMPYTVTVTILMYIMTLTNQLRLGEINIKGFIFGFFDNFVFDILYLTRSFGELPLVGPLWYLSAMFIGFPVLSIFVQLRNRYWIMLISFSYPLYYYGHYGFVRNHDILRVLAAMCLGVFIYEVVHGFRQYINSINKILLTCIEGFTFLFPLVTTYFNIASSRFIIFCFVVCLAVMLPGLSYSSHIKGKVFTYLGKLGMPLYIIHWYVGSLFGILDEKFCWNTKDKVCLYYGITIIASIVAMYLVEHWKWFQNKIKKPIELKD